MKSFRALHHLHEENVRIQQIIDEEVEQIEPEVGMLSIRPLLHSRGSDHSVRAALQSGQGQMRRKWSKE